MAGGNFLPRDAGAARPAATLGRRIADAREAAGLTTAQLARRAGVKTATLSNWESGRSEPRANRLVMLAGIVGVSPTWLIEGYGAGPAHEVAGDDTSQLRRDLAIARDAAARLTAIIEDIDRRLARMERTG